MTSRITESVVDCANPGTLARFWAATLGYEVLEESPDKVEIGPSGRSDQQRLEDVRKGPVYATVVFARVPEGKVGKNRLHFDLSPVDADHETEMTRLQGLGATVSTLSPPGSSWTVMHDPEGNEFCLVRSLAPGHFSL